MQTIIPASSTAALHVAAAAVRMYAESHPRPTHVTRGQACEMLGLSRPTINRLLEFGTLKINRCGMIPIELIDQARAVQEEEKAARRKSTAPGGNIWDGLR